MYPIIFFIQVFNVLRANNIRYSFSKNRVVAFYLPKFHLDFGYEPVTLGEEYRFIISKLSTIVSSIKKLFISENPYEIRIFTYSDLGPPPSSDAIPGYRPKKNRKVHSIFIRMDFGFFRLCSVGLTVFFIDQKSKTRNCT